MDTLTKITKSLKEQQKSQTDLCAFLGIKKNAYTNWKNGHTKSYLKYLPQIAEFLGVSVDYLAGNSETNSAPNYNNQKLSDTQANIVKKLLLLDDNDTDKINAYIDGLLSADKYSAENELLQDTAI